MTSQPAVDGRAATIRIGGTLAKLFPPDHPDSPWLFRLAIIRDDIEWELRNLPLRREDGPEQVWRCTYFLRRLSVSILEARDVLAHEVSEAIKRPADEAMARLAPHIREAVKVVAVAVEAIKPLRNVVGAHVRPQNADPQGPKADRPRPPVEAQVLRNAAGSEVAALVSLWDSGATTFRGLTVLAPVLPWPEDASDQAMARRHEVLSRAIRKATGNVLAVIDALLLRHWWNLGLLKLPTDRAMAILDWKTRDYVALREPGL
jgi:hypothetical protein